MEKRRENRGQAIGADHPSAEVAEPSNCSLDDPAAREASDELKNAPLRLLYITQMTYCLGSKEVGGVMGDPQNLGLDNS